MTTELHIPSGAGQAETRQRLLEAAGEVFAERGFHGATIREICLRAGANGAAVNYHFGDKVRLYAEVLKYSNRCAALKHPPDMGLAPGAAPRARLRVFIRSMFLRTFDEGQPAWRGRLMSREMIEPTAALDSLVEEEIGPRAEMLRDIVRDLLGDRADDETVRLCSLSIVGQVHFHHHARPLIDRLYPDQGYGSDEIERLAEHVTDFALAGLKGVRGAGKSSAGKNGATAAARRPARRARKAAVRS